MNLEDIMSSNSETESRMVGASDWRKRGWGSCCLMGIVSDVQDEKVHEVGCTTM